MGQFVLSNSDMQHTVSYIKTQKETKKNTQKTPLDDSYFYLVEEETPVFSLTVHTEMSLLAH